MAQEDIRHPFLEGLSRHRGAPSTIIIIFGASGDLTRRKLIPSLYNLGTDNLLPADFLLIGCGRKNLGDDNFRQFAREAISEHARRTFDEDSWRPLAEKIFYLAGGYDDPQTYKDLAEKIEGLERSTSRQHHLLFYISTPPAVFKPILQNLGASGLSRAIGPDGHAATVIIEKPFGRDLSTARELNQIITNEFDEKQVYRIDHYLGKETVQDLLVQRFANSIFEPIWNRRFVDCVQITVAEDLGVGTRAGYYDQSGALRDMIQNHTMQLLALTAMEPPVSLDAEAIRDEKVKVLKAIQPLTLSAENADAVRGQFTEGIVGGRKVSGYMQADGVPPTSHTETYTALRLFINNWRWQGVPFYLRSGKRMARKVSEISVHFKRPPGVLFTESDKFDVAANTMVIRIQPDEGVMLLFNSKIPGLETRTQPVKMHFRYATTYGSNTPEAYERLLLDAMTGDATLFIRGDETEASWKIVTPVLDFWNDCGKRGLETYVSGSWGPLAAERLLWDYGHQWRRAGP